MTTIMLCALALAALSLTLGFYYRTAEANLSQAGVVWANIRQDIQALVDDEGIPERIAQNVTMFAIVAGCGCVTRGMFADLVVGHIRRRFAEDHKIAAELERLTDEQRERLSRVIGGLLLFDSYHAPILGSLLRWLMTIPMPATQIAKRDDQLEKLEKVLFSADHAGRNARNRLPAGFIAA